MNVKNMVKDDAVRWFEASKLDDILRAREELIPGYQEALHDALINIKNSKQFDKHVKDINRYRNQLSNPPKKPLVSGKMVLVGATVLVAAAVAHETGYDTRLRLKIQRKWDAFKNGPAPVATEKTAETDVSDNAV